MVFPKQEPQKVLYEISNLPLAVESDRKPGFIPLGCETSQRHSTARVPITRDEEKFLRNTGAFVLPAVESGTSLNNIEIASANMYKNEIKSKSLY